VDEPFETFGHTIEALEPNTTYNIRAVATNSGIGGTGQSERQTFTTPPEDIITVPTAPLNLSATPGSGQVALSWSAPVSDGGAAITRYEVSVNDGLWAATQTMTGHTVTGLSSGTHTFRVRAVNAQGAGLSASVTAVVTAAPVMATITFDANGGEFDPTELTAAFGTAFEIGMYHETTGFNEANSIDMAAEVQPVPMSITTITRNLPVGAQIGVLPVARRVGHTSIGWFTAQIGGIQITETMVVDGDMSLWTGWQENPTITNPATDGQTVLMQNLPVSWLPVPGATEYRFTLVNMTTGSTQINNQSVSGTSFTIPVSHFTVGHIYRVEVAAIVGGSPFISTRAFTVGQLNHTITNPAQNGDTVYSGDLAVTWEEIPRATYHFTLVNMTTGSTPLNNLPVSGTEFTVLSSHLTIGHQFRVEVTATVGGQSILATRVFTVIPAPPAPGITVTVVDAGGRPVQGALVQFVHGVVNWSYDYTNANGIAFLPDAVTGRWGVNVTHPNFASTAQTSTPYIRDANRRRIPNFYRTSVNQVQSKSFVMSEPISYFRNLGWVNVLPDMHIQDNHRVSSAYGFRRRNGATWHMGIDLVGRTENNITTQGRRVLSAFHGTVEQVWNDSDYAGYAIVVRRNDRDSRHFFYARYTHLQLRPSREDEHGVRTDLLVRNNVLDPGEVLGRIGNTGESDGYHLHLEVFRSDRGEWSYLSMRNVAHSIDPRAFFAPDFARPWR